MKFKILCFVFALIACMAVMVSCGADEPIAPDTTSALINDTESVDTTESTTTGDTEPMPEFNTPDSITLKIGDDGKVNYKVIRPLKSKSGSPEITAASKISASFSNIMGVALELDTDWQRTNDSEALEIVVGLTDYDETAAAIEELKYGEYIIKAVGNKIVIMGYTPDAVEKAAAKFIDLCKAGYDESSKTVELTTSDLYSKETVTSSLNVLPALLGKNLSTVYYDAGIRVTGKRCDQLLISEITEDIYSEYVSKMTESGLSLYTSTEMVKNKFATFTKDKYTVTLGYFAYDKTLRITVEEDAPVAGLESENKYTKVTTAQISLLGQAVTTEENGLSVLIRLEDGRFIVIDGGYKGSKYATTFINEVKKQAKEYTDKPVIAAWIITHNHIDHDALFYPHASEIEGKGITIERVMMNMVSESEAERLDALVPTTGVGRIDSYAHVLTAAKKIGATVYKPHTGQVFWFANAKMEVLSTHESIYPAVIPTLNSMSLVMKFTFTDSETGKTTTFLSTGDATCNTFESLYNNFNDYIGCDILCMAHHGGTVGSGTSYSDARYTTNAYKVINPTLALFPIGGEERTVQVDKSAKDANVALFACSNFKECYVAGYLGDVTVVPLPYAVGTVTGPYKYK